jgi:nucleotide-binding universal stress UspA family protein
MMAGTESTGAKAQGGTPSLFHSWPQAAKEGQPKTLPSAEGRLLACLDEGEMSASILEQALAVARGLDLSVTAARVLDTSRHLTVPADPLEWRVRRRVGLDRLDHLVAARGGEGADIERVLLAGPVADELTGWATSHHVTLIAIGTHSRRDSQGGLGMTTQRLLERAPVSLLLVPTAPRREVPYRRLMVPLDGSCRAESVLPIATRIARAHGAELILVHAVPHLEGVGSNDDDAEAGALCLRLSDRYEQGARDYLHRLELQSWKEQLPVRAIVAREGDPRAKLRQLALSQKVDLIVMSSHGRSGMGDVPCGSVTEYIATHAPAPLLIVRPNFAHVFSTPTAPEIQGAQGPTAEQA